MSLTNLQSVALKNSANFPNPAAVVPSGGNNPSNQENKSVIGFFTPVNSYNLLTSINFAALAPTKYSYSAFFVPGEILGTSSIAVQLLVTGIGGTGSANLNLNIFPMCADGTPNYQGAIYSEGTPNQQFSGYGTIPEVDNQLISGATAAATLLNYTFQDIDKPHYCLFPFFFGLSLANVTAGTGTFRIVGGGIYWAGKNTFNPG